MLLLTQREVKTLAEEKGYTPQQAYQAVVTGGTHAGPIGGLKKSWFYRNLKGFIWKKTDTE